MAISEQAVRRPAARVSALPMLATVFALLFVAASIPVAMVKTPVMIDFFNHLGRIFVIANLDRDPLLAKYYSVDWRIIPNLAMDALVPMVARHIGIYLAGKLFVLATMALMLTGVQAISLALYRRLSLWPLVAFLFVYNWVFFYGFINYLFGVGVALWGIAAWIHWRGRPPLFRFLVSLFFVVVLFASHLYALGLYGVALACYEAWLLRDRGLPGRRRLVADGAAFALPFLLVLPLMAASPTSNYALETVWRLPEKIDGLYFVIKTYFAPVDLAFGFFCVVALAWAVGTRRLRIHPVGWFALVGFAVLYLAMPTKLFGSGIADMRLPIAALFILIGMAQWEMRPPFGAAAFCAVVVGVAFLRFALVGLYWHEYDQIVGDFEHSFQDIKPGSRVLVAGRYDTGMSYTQMNMIAHMPCLVMIERSSLESLAFTHPGKQVLRVAPAFRATSLFEGVPPDIGTLLRSDPAALDPAWANWRSRFDYVYLLYSDAQRLGPADGLTLLYSGRGFQLYQIMR